MIVVTGHEHYGVRALNEGAVYYVLKPIDPDVLICAVERLWVRYGQKSTTRGGLYLRVAAGHEQVFLFDTLLYCTSEGNYCRLYLERKESFMVCMSMKELCKLLPAQFVRIEHSCTVNAGWVAEYLYDNRHAQVVLEDGTVLGVSRRRRGVVRKQLQQLGVSTSGRGGRAAHVRIVRSL